MVLPSRKLSFPDTVAHLLFALPLSFCLRREHQNAPEISLPAVGQKPHAKDGRAERRAPGSLPASRGSCSSPLCFPLEFSLWQNNKFLLGRAAGKYPLHAAKSNPNRSGIRLEHKKCPECPHSGIYSSSQQIFAEHLLCAMHCAMLGRCSKHWPRPRAISTDTVH